MSKSPSLQIFQDSCETIAQSLIPNGFKYLKSKRQSQRQGLIFEHIITFATSRSINSIPGNVHLNITAMACSQALADYRQAAGISLSTNESFLFYTPIENIFQPAPPYIRYDIGDPQLRPTIINHINQVLRQDVLRFFELIESPEALRSALKSESIPSLSQDAIRDYFAYFALTR
jgi:hypothetical protein